MDRYYLLFSFFVFNYCLAENEYYTYENIDSTLHAWQEIFGFSSHTSNHYSEFGIIYNLDTIGFSSQDSLPIFAVKLSANADITIPQPRVLIIGQCHAEEIYGVEIAMEIINQFLNPDENPGYSNRGYLIRGLAYTEIWIIPTLNPEGLRVVHGYIDSDTLIQDVTYRKNKRDIENYGNFGMFDYVATVGQDIDGVDLNRNYDFNWSFGDTLLVPTASCNPNYEDDFDYYRGKSPGSEDEVKSLMEWAIEKKFLLSIAYHSSRSGCVDRYVIYPWAWKDKFGENDREYSPGFDVIERLGINIAEIAGMYETTGSSYRKGNAHDWLYRETGCIQYLIEVGAPPPVGALGPVYHDEFGDRLLVEDEKLDQVVASNMDAFFHLLMRAGGQTYNNDPNESGDGSQILGVVSDAVTGLPIPGAIINIPELEGKILKPRKTDKLGFYSRILHPDNPYTLIVSANGYQTSDTLDVYNTNSGAQTLDLSLIPSPRYDLTFNIQSLDSSNPQLQLIIQNLFIFDTLNIMHGSSITLPKDNYRLIINSLEYIPQVFDIDLLEDTELSISLLYEQVVWEENDFVNWDQSSDTEELSISLNNLTGGENLMIEIHFKYELEWDYDYFRGYYIHLEDTIKIMEFTGDHYKDYTEYIPLTIPDGHTNSSLFLHLDKDDTIWATSRDKYRGVEIDYIKVTKGSESLNNTTDIFGSTPKKYQLYQNFPNPFNPKTNIRFSVPYFSQVSISIYNIRGELIDIIVNRNYQPGDYIVSIDAQEYVSGVYFYRFESGMINYTKKLVIIK